MLVIVYRLCHLFKVSFSCIQRLSSFLLAQEEVSTDNYSGTFHAQPPAELRADFTADGRGSVDSVFGVVANASGIEAVQP